MIDVDAILATLPEPGVTQPDPWGGANLLCPKCLHQHWDSDDAYHCHCGCGCAPACPHRLSS